MSDLLIPPSINWFHNNSVDSLPKERIFAIASYKNVTVFKIPDEVEEPPKAIKLIPHQGGRVLGVALYPFEHEYFGHSLCVLGENSSLSLIDINTKAYLSQHSVQKTNLHSLCWATLDNEEVVVAVGESGRMVVWQPRFLVAHSLQLYEGKTMSLISVVPHCRHEAIVVCQETLLHVHIKDGSTLGKFKGHDKEIYSLKWCPADVNPFSRDDLVLNTRWKEDKPAQDDAEQRKGPFFVTSDLKRNVFVWDFSLGRYIVKTLAVGTGGYYRNIKDKSRPQHISLAWANNRLFSSSTFGEILTYDLNSNDVQAKVVAHPHDKAIYNMENVGDLVLTFSLDRNIKGFNVATNKLAFQLTTMGSCANAMAFSPHDAYRLAIGHQDNSIALLTFGSKSLSSHKVGIRIQGKVISVAWHPETEGKLLFGSSDGQVGIVEISSGKMNTFSHFHARPAYKVEWGPPLFPEKTGISDPLCIYSFGDNEILLRKPSDLMAAPTKMNPFIKNDKDTKEVYLKITEFSFSFDSKFFAVGFVNGTIKVFDTQTAALKVTIVNIRKTIQHILWKPPFAADSPYVLAVGSGESSVYIYNLDSELKGDAAAPYLVLEGTKELSGHSARVIWLSWSPHKDGLLASASYDHTVQIWDVNKGEPVVNYGGHSHRVFRVEFSPLDPDLVISFAEENCIHQWRMSKLTCKTSSASLSISKSLKPKTRTFGEAALEQRKRGNHATSQNGEGNPQQQSTSECLGNDSSVEDIPTTTEISLKPTFSRNGGASRRPPNPPKALFTHFHSLSSRKRNFHHFAILSLLQEKLQEASLQATPNGQNSAEGEDDLAEDFSLGTEIPPPADDNSTSVKVKSKQEIIQETLENYEKITPRDNTLPSVEDVAAFLDFFGDLSGVNRVLSREINAHEKKENFLYSNMIHCWRGSLSDEIKWAAKHKKLSPFLISIAPQVSFSLWEYACEAYAEQLAEGGEITTAATYLVSLHKIEAAIDLLLKHRLFKEAFAIAKVRMPFQPEVTAKVINAWSMCAGPEGNFEIVSLLNLSMGDIENAARTMSRRTEPSALTVASLLYDGAKCHELALSTATLALKDCSLRNEFAKIELLLQSFAELAWFKGIYLCLKSVLGLKEWSNKDSDVRTEKNILEISRETNATYNVGEHPLKNLPPNHPFLYIVHLWEENRILLPQYKEYSSQIKQCYTERPTPASAKQLWFLTSISLSEMIMDMSIHEASRQESSSPQMESGYVWEPHLDKLLYYFISWAKYDQAYYLTHFLLPAGTTKENAFEISSKSSCSHSLRLLKKIFILSEFGLLLELMEGRSCWVPWKMDNEATSSSTDEHQSQEDTSLTDDREDHLSSNLPQLNEEKETAFGTPIASSHPNEIDNKEEICVAACIENTPLGVESQMNSLTISDSSIKSDSKTETDSEAVNEKPLMASKDDPPISSSASSCKTHIKVPPLVASQYPVINFKYYENKEEFLRAFQILLHDLNELLREEKVEEKEEGASSADSKSPEPFQSESTDFVDKIITKLLERGSICETVSTALHLLALSLS